MFPKLKYPAFEGRISSTASEGIFKIFDNVRKKWLVLTPEEWVRQHVVNYLISAHNYPASLISIEKVVELNGQKKRYDLVVLTKKLKPLIIVECKAPTVELSQEVLEQAARYNLTLKVPYVLITNGLNDQLYKDGKITADFPALGELE
jgi:hypothetical protein